MAKRIAWVLRWLSDWLEDKPRMGSGDYSCATCGMGMKEPCEHWRNMMENSLQDITATLREACGAWKDRVENAEAELTRQLLMSEEHPHLAYEERQVLLSRWAKYGDPKAIDWVFEARPIMERHAINAVLDLQIAEAQLAEKSLLYEQSQKHWREAEAQLADAQLVPDKLRALLVQRQAEIDAISAHNAQLGEALHQMLMEHCPNKLEPCDGPLHTKFRALLSSPDSVEWLEAHDREVRAQAQIEAVEAVVTHRIEKRGNGWFALLRNDAEGQYWVRFRGVPEALAALSGAPATEEGK